MEKMTAVRPVFIVGAPRSGTSVSTWALGQHPNIQPMPETSWLATMAAGGYLSYLKGSERGRFSHLSNVEYPIEPFMARIGDGLHQVVCDVYEERCRRLYGDFRALGRVPVNKKNPDALQVRRGVDDPKQRWIDGTPLNSQFIWGLRLLFPHARFWHLLRRPEDVAVSLIRFDAVGGVPQSEKNALETWYVHTENAVLAARAFGTGVVKTTRYEQLIAEPEREIRAILEFLEEPYSADCLLAFGEKINSSNVGEERETLAGRVRALRRFNEAERLYGDALDAATGAEGTLSEAAAGILRQRFTDHCADRTLL
jgi:Sulfotransferase family